MRQFPIRFQRGPLEVSYGGPTGTVRHRLVPHPTLRPILIGQSVAADIRRDPATLREQRPSPPKKMPLFSPFPSAYTLN